ncbi:MAG: thioredoxin domain-containing protein [Streptosporangiales bacterium]|nr:thioredoxin domain-containing protein [Streptosporangiales bacterium]
MDRFDADRQDPKLRKAVQRDFGFGQALGVPGTPAFLVGGAPLFGAQPYDVFERAIDQARKGQ